MGTWGRERNNDVGVVSYRSSDIARQDPEAKQSRWSEGRKRDDELETHTGGRQMNRIQMKGPKGWE